MSNISHNFTLWRVSIETRFSKVEIYPVWQKATGGEGAWERSKNERACIGIVLFIAPAGRLISRIYSFADTSALSRALFP